MNFFLKGDMERVDLYFRKRFFRKAHNFGQIIYDFFEFSFFTCKGK